MAIGKLKKMQIEYQKNPKKIRSKPWNFEEKKEKMKLLQVQNKKEIKKVQKEKGKVWRKEEIDESKLQELRVCFAVEMTVEQACFFSKVKERTFYSYKKRHPDFEQEIVLLKQSISMQAKVNIAKAIKANSVADSWKRLEKKDSEFMPKVKFEWWIPINMSDEDKEMYDKILQNNKILPVWKKEIKN